MEYAKDLLTHKIVPATAARRSREYVCARPGCGGRVYLPDVRIQRPHFRHFPHEGTPACDEYVPGTGASQVASNAAVEDRPEDLGLLVEHEQGHWALALRLPEVSSADLGHAPLSALRSGFVEVRSGSDLVARISAIDVRPGASSPRVHVPPSLEQYRLQPSGQWPSGIATERWRKSARPLHAYGSLFRLRREEWTRLCEASCAHWDEELIVVGDRGHAPPRSIVVETGDRRVVAGVQWTMWRVQLRLKEQADVLPWIQRLGHAVVQSPWSAGLVSVPAFLADSATAGVWLGKPIVFELESPAPNRRALATLSSEDGTTGAFVQVANNRRTYLGISVASPGPVQLRLKDEQESTFAFVTAEPPSASAMREALERVPRLRLRIDDLCFEPWATEGPHAVNIRKGDTSEVQLDAGVDAARVTLVIHSNGKRKTRRMLALQDAEPLISEALLTATAVEIDAGNLGHVSLRIVREMQRPSERVSDRLAWWRTAAHAADAAMGLPTTALMQSYRHSSVRTLSPVSALELVQGRMRARNSTRR